MKKIIDYLKGLFSNKPRLEERYTLNRKCLGRSQELKRFIEERQYYCEMYGIKFSIIEKDFPADQYGKVDLVLNNKVVETAKLIRGKLNLIYWKFDE